jgi:hypothetical protein
MKYFLIISLLLSSLYTSDIDDEEFEIPKEFDRQAYNSGEATFEQKCTQCHVKYIDVPKAVNNFFRQNNKLELKAPTANMISYRLKLRIGSKEDIEFHLHDTNEFLQSFLMNPDRSKTVCLEGVIKYFETMPSMKGVVNEKEIENINHFLYFLEGFNGINEFFYDETIF